MSHVADHRPPGRGRATALVVLAAASAVAWWSVLGAALLWAAPVVVLAAAVAVGLARPRAATAGLAVWLVAAPLLAGVPVSAFGPRALGGSVDALRGGFETLAVAGRMPPAGDPWPAAAALLLAGVVWLTAAVLATRRDTASGVTALVLPTLPLVWALALEQTSDAAWPGAVLVAAGVLWTARGRLAALVPATAAVALVAAIVGQAVGPEEQWIPFVDASARAPQFSRLDPTQSYGPLRDRRTGAEMLVVESPRPALWRMQVLERFTGRWGVELRDEPDLPQPAARTVAIDVTVEGLRNRLVASPGRVVGVEGGGGAYLDAGEGRQLRVAPEPGDTYRVESQVVDATADELQDVPVPTGPQYDEYTEIWPRSGRPGDRPRLLRTIDAYPRLREAYGDRSFVRVLGIAHRLAAGTESQLEIVRRVRAFLVDSGRFRYTTDVPVPGAEPLEDFLLRGRAGYCQQFAGAAALLLRLAGVPTRVVTGFATGEASGDDRYVVRDEDAHAWIEVYFPDHGWVPFDMTPADTTATVDAALDILAPPSAAGASGGGAGPAVLVAAVGLLAAGAGLVGHRRRRDEHGAAVPTEELLARLVPDAAAPGTTLRGLRPALEGIGPAVASLAVQVEHARFAGTGPDRDRHPRLRVWRALRRDVGPTRATVLLARHGLRGPGPVRPELP